MASIERRYAGEQDRERFAAAIRAREKAIARGGGGGGDDVVEREEELIEEVSEGEAERVGGERPQGIVFDDGNESLYEPSEAGDLTLETKSNTAANAAIGTHPSDSSTLGAPSRPLEWLTPPEGFAPRFSSLSFKASPRSPPTSPPRNTTGDGFASSHTRSQSNPKPSPTSPGSHSRTLRSRTRTSPVSSSSASRMQSLQTPSELLGRAGMSSMATLSLNAAGQESTHNADWYFDPSGSRSSIRRKNSAAGKAHLDSEIASSLFGSQGTKDLTMTSWVEEMGRDSAFSGAEKVPAPLTSGSVSGLEGTFSSIPPSPPVITPEQLITEDKVSPTETASTAQPHRPQSPSPSIAQSHTSSRTAGAASSEGTRSTITSFSSHTVSTPPTSDPPSSSSLPPTTPSLSLNEKPRPHQTPRTRSRMAWDTALYSAAPPDAQFEEPERKTVEASLERAGFEIQKGGFSFSGDGKISGAGRGEWRKGLSR